MSDPQPDIGPDYDPGGLPGPVIQPPDVLDPGPVEIPDDGGFGDPGDGRPYE